MTQVERLANFVAGATFECLSAEARQELKVRVLDALACAVGALGAEPMVVLRRQLDDFGGAARCTLIGGGRTAPDRAAFYNGALVRYLDFNDSYLAPGETCHPSDNLGAVLAAGEYANAAGKDLLLALAVAYQTQCRLSDEAPVRAKGFDHTTQGAYAVAAGVAKALGLSAEATANALAISGTALNALRVTRTGALSHWKGLAFPHTAFAATHAAFLAGRGITGPREVFEGNKGFMQAIAGPFEIDWSREDLERVRRTIVKRFNAEIHSQSVVEGLLELRHEHGVSAAEVEAVGIDIFDVAYDIIGGGEEGGKTAIRTKEEADHSLPYIAAVALLDGEVMPAQYRPTRIVAADVQDLLRRVSVRPCAEYSGRFPAEIPCRLTLRLRDGRRLTREKSDYEGFFTRPVAWERVVEKFHRLRPPALDAGLAAEIVDAIAALERIPLRELSALLGRIPDPTRR